MFYYIVYVVHARFQLAAGRGVDLLCGIVGRERVVRAARFALHRSRRDLPNHPRYNGEWALQGWLLAAIPPAEPLTVFDVGAHVGRWSASLLELAGRTGHRPRLHAFEPASDTHRQLAANLPAPVVANRLAVSDVSGEMTLYVVRPGAGRNSLHTDGSPAQVERVTATTIDEYAACHAISHVHLLKVDAEGHDVRVLRGAEHLFQAGAVSVAQFEYNHRWVDSRHFLKDAFELLEPLGYRIGKLTPRGVEWYPAWDPDLETFVEGNYLACTLPLGVRLPAVRWWKEARTPCTLD
jgi:FkbM family methyltransferase